MEYEVYLRREAFEFLRQRHRDDREQLLALFRQLGRDPFRRGDFSKRFTQQPPTLAMAEGSEESNVE